MIGHILKRCGIFLAIACIAACDAGFMNQEDRSSSQSDNFQKTLSDDTACFSVERTRISDNISAIKANQNKEAGYERTRCYMLFYEFSNGEEINGKLYMHALELFITRKEIDNLEAKCGIHNEYIPRFRARVSVLFSTCPLLLENMFTSKDIAGFNLGKFFASNYHSTDISVAFNQLDESLVPYMTAGVMEDEIHGVVPICLYNSDINGVNVDEFIRTGHLDYVEGCLFRYIDN